MSLPEFIFADHAALHRPRDQLPGRKPSVLYLTNKLRRQPDSGGARREYEILRRLTPRFDIHYVALTPNFEEERATLDALPLPFASATLVRTHAETARDSKTFGTWNERFAHHAAPVGRSVLAWLLQRYRPAVVHCEGCFLLQHLENSLCQPLVLLEENVESELGRDRDRIADLDPSGPDYRSEEDKTGSNAETERIETALWHRADALVAVTKEDAEIMHARVPGAKVTCLPNGGNPAAAPLLDAESGRALYVANFAWAPSRDACLHLLDTLWPHVLAINTAARLLLAGAGMDASLRAKAAQLPGVEVTSPFGSFQDVAARAALCISPLRFGGGHKMKVVEALCAGLPIIATSLSLRGFSSRVREAVIVADDMDTFAARTAALLSAPDVCRRLGHASLHAAADLAKWIDVADGLARVWIGVAPSLSQSAKAPPELVGSLARGCP